MSFTGSLDALLSFAAASAQATTCAQRRREQAVGLDRLNFTGSLDALLGFAAASALATTPAQRRRVWAGLLARLVADLVPLRPGRHEPCSVKRRPKSYPHLNRPRRDYRVVRHGTRLRPISQKT